MCSRYSSSSAASRARVEAKHGEGAREGRRGVTCGGDDGGGDAVVDDGRDDVGGAR